ncbi:MAG: permease, partial [bacterium]
MMYDAFRGVALESLNLLLKMSPYLLFGFFVAGIIHVFVSLESVARHLGKSSVGSVIKAVILGIPLPLCSCGVIPAAVLLKKKGASRGAITSFLIATPITGVDSIFATYSLMGLFFTVYRIIASSLTAFIAGLLANLFIKDAAPAPAGHAPANPHCHHCEERANASLKKDVLSRNPNRFVELFRYAFVELFGDVWRWLALGLIIGGIISYAIPAELIE